MITLHQRETTFLGAVSRSPFPSDQSAPFKIIPCVQLAPVPLSIHTSWRAYSSPLLGPRCSPARRWGAPWWPAHPHLQVGIGYEKEWQTSLWTKKAEKHKYVHQWPSTGYLTQHNAHREKQACWRVFYEAPVKKASLWSHSPVFCFCSPFLWTVATSRMLKAVLIREQGYF